MYGHNDRPQTPVKYRGDQKHIIKGNNSTLAVWTTCDKDNIGKDYLDCDLNQLGEEPTKDNVPDFGPDTSIHFEESVIHPQKDSRHTQECVEPQKPIDARTINYQELNGTQFEYLLCKSPVSLIGSSSSSTSSLQNVHVTPPYPDFRDLGLMSPVGDIIQRHTMNMSHNSNAGGQGRTQTFSPPPLHTSQNGRSTKHVTSPTPVDGHSLEEERDAVDGVLSDTIKVITETI